MGPEVQNHDPDTWTLIAIGALVCASASIIHEGIGHGGMCWLTGGHAQLLSSVEFQCDRDTRWISAAGTIANLIAGLLFWAASRMVRHATRWRFFLWLSMAVNLLQAAGYFLFSGVGNIGDWAAVIQGLSPAWAWRIGMIVLGAILYALSICIALRELRPFLAGAEERWRRAKKLCLVPYLTIGILSCIAGAFNPTGMILIAISAAAASFGGASGLAWMWQFFRGPRLAYSGAHLPPLARSKAWLGAALVVTALFIGILGPGITFR